MERDLGDGESPDERGVVEMRGAGHRVAVGAEAEAVELPPARRAGRQPLVGPVQDARVEELAVALGLDGEVAVAVVLMDGRAIADAPVDQPAASGQGHAARAQAAERKGDMAATRAAIDEARVDPVLGYVGSDGVHSASS